MTDLLRPATRRTSSGAPHPDGRALALNAVLGGVVSAGSTLLLSAAVALAGWFSADAGAYGDTRDAVRVGADAWLLAHGAGLRLDATTITVMPLGLTALAGYVCYRVGVRRGARAGTGSAPAGLSTVLLAAGVQATVYALVALATAVLAGVPSAESSLSKALAGGFLVSLLAGGFGLLVGAGHVRRLLARAPAAARVVVSGGLACVLLGFASGSFLVFGALVDDFGTAATVLSRLHADGPGGLMYTLVGILFVPNAALLGGAYLLGPGFAVGTGTVVSPTAVVLGPVPAFPLLAALPGDGATPAWTTVLLGLPVLVAAVGVLLALRRAPVPRLDVGAMLGLAAGVAAAVLLTVLVLLAGGSAGPGRMGDVGASAGSTLLAALVSFGGGGLVGGVAGAWWSRRRSGADPSRRTTADR